MRSSLLIFGMLMTAVGVSRLPSSDPTLTFRVLGAPDPGEWQSPIRIQVQPGKLTVLGTELQRIGGQLEAKLHTAPLLLALEVCDRSSLFASTDSARASRWDRVRYEAIIQPLPSGRYRFDVSPCPLDYGVLVSETQEVVIP